MPRRRQRESSRPAHRRQSADSPDVTGKPAAILRLTSSILAGSFTSSFLLHLITSSFSFSFTFSAGRATSVRKRTAEESTTYP